MKNEGLCSNCEHSKACIFIGNGPIWQCEEFSIGVTTNRVKSLKKVKQIYEEVTEAE